MTTPPTPPRWPRRPSVPVLFYAHPFELSLGIVLVVQGIRGLLTGDSSPAVDATLPEFPLLAYRLLNLLAGVGIVVGLLIRERALGRAVERAACWLAAGGYLAYVVLLEREYGLIGDATWNMTTAAAVAIGCALRARAGTKTERVILATMRAANADPRLLRRMVDGRPPEDQPEAHA